MKKDLAAKITRKIKRDRNQIKSLEVYSFEFRKAYIELQNLLSLKEYPIYLYDTGVLLTDKNGYRKENNIPDGVSDEEVKQGFISRYHGTQRQFDEMINQPLSESDIAIHQLMSTEEGYNYLDNAQFHVRTILEERDNLRIRIPMLTDVYQIKSLEMLEDDVELSIGELISLKEKIQVILSKMPDIEDLVLNYSPEYLNHIINDDYPNNIERLKALFALIHIHPQDPAFEKYTDYYFDFNMLYKEYKRLNRKAYFSKKAREELHQVVNKLIDLYHQLVELLNNAIMKRENNLESVFGSDFIKKNTADRLFTLDHYTDELKELIIVLNKAFDKLLRQKEYKNNQIKIILDEIKEKTGVIISNAEDFASKDLWESYEKVDLRSQAKTLDNLSMIEIIETYGHVADEHVYRTIPIK